MTSVTLCNVSYNRRAGAPSFFIMPGHEEEKPDLLKDPNCVKIAQYMKLQYEFGTPSDHTDLMTTADILDLFQVELDPNELDYAMESEGFMKTHFGDAFYYLLNRVS